MIAKFGKRWRILLFTLLVVSGLWCCNTYRQRLVRRSLPQSALAARILEGARAQIGTRYDASYRVIPYPGGDMPNGAGACTDVVIRAIRRAGWDLQVLVHEDMRQHRTAYPHNNSATGLDTSIDHRRVPNLACFFSRHAATLTRDTSPRTLAQWQPGDIVCWKTLFGRDHIGIVSNGVDATGVPFVIHNEYGCVEENCLTRWRIVRHYRLLENSAYRLFTKM